LKEFVKRKKELREKIREVVLHEIGHYLGMDEEQVRKVLRKRWRS
jgi:predicted Zn-dependent protease with MMP-like domain